MQISAQPCRSISGVVIDSNNAPLSSVIVNAFFDGKDFYGVSNNMGAYTIRLCSSIDGFKKWQVSIAISLIGYKRIDTVITVGYEKVKVGDIVLMEQVTVLKDVIVKVKPIEKRGDTTAYNVGSFQNKLDENLEDVLKKMPGFDIDESGAIKFNGKPISNILIEGDEMSKNYKAISQNISPDMINKVEMIEKWNKNPILKDLAGGNAQVMNLTLKNPNLVSAFGKAKVGGGVENKVNVTGNAFLINAKLKSMAIANLNNIGTNPYSEIDYSKDYAPNQEYEFSRTILPNHIGENNLFGQSVFGSQQKNDLINNSRMGVLNNNYRPNKTTNIKLFSDIYFDRIIQIQQVDNNNLAAPSLSFQQKTFKKFTPHNINTNLQLIQTKNNAQFLLSAVLEKKRYQEDAATISFNDFTSLMASDYTRAGVGGYYTKRLDSNRAYEISLQYLHDAKQQDYTIDNDNFRILDLLYKTKWQQQQANGTINYFKAEAKYFRKSKKLRTERLSISNIYFNTVFLSGLSIKDSVNSIVIPEGYLNRNAVQNNNMLLNYSSSFKLKQFSISADFGVSLVQNQFVNKVQSTSSVVKSIFAVPKINFTYTLNSKNILALYIANNADSPPLDMQEVMPILSGFRYINKSLPFMNNLQHRILNIAYNFSDLNKGTSLQISASHFRTSQSQVRNIRFTRDFDYTISRFEDKGQVFSSLYTKFDKYFFDAKTAINIKNTLSLFNTPIELNGVIASTRTLNYKSGFLIRPNVFTNTNIAIGVNYDYTKDLISGNSVFQWHPNLDILSSIGKKVSMGFRGNYYRSNYNPFQKDYWLANAHIWYIFIPKKLDLKLSMVNIFNTSQYFTGFKNGFLERSDATNLLSRFGLLELSFKF